MAYEDFKDLAKRTALDKLLRDKAFNISKNPKYDGYQKGFASLVFKFFDKTTSGSGANKNNKQNQHLSNDFHRRLIKKFKKNEEFSLHLKKIFGLLI